MKKSICLVGYMGSGKSKVARHLSEHCGWEFQDTDEIIEGLVGMSVADIFRKYGEFHFRKLERRVLKYLVNSSPSVISTGGGLPCYYDNMDIICRSFSSVYLGLSPKNLVTRLMNNQRKRPLLDDLSETSLLDKITNDLKIRNPFYQRADLKVDNTDLNDTLQRIETFWKA